jgi:hypothetical protein
VQDHKLNRPGADQREDCDKRSLQPLGEVTAAEQPNVNMVDLRRDAVQGSMPHNDRVRLQKISALCMHRGERARPASALDLFDSVGIGILSVVAAAE